MHAERLLHGWLSDVLPGMHMRRLCALGVVVSAAIRVGRLTVTSLGRSLRSSAEEKHNIKRADRLLSNLHLQSEIVEVYSQVAKQLIGAERHPIVLVDWSDVDARRTHFILRAAIPMKGRALTLYEEVHPRSTKEKRTTHNRFLQKLKDILPPDCKPIIVTDAGFRNPWFKRVRSLGWNFVGRIRNRELVTTAAGKPWTSAKSLYSKATHKPKMLVETVLCRSNPLNCSLVLYKAKRKGRVHRGKMGRKSRATESRLNAARAREPWLLATSLAVDVHKVIRIYAMRMQIEESFRDLKCPRHGLSLYFNGTYRLERLRILVLIGSLATTFAWLLGKIAQHLKLHRHFQANTERRHNVLSCVFVGTRAFRKKRLKLSKRKFMRLTKLLTKIDAAA